MMPIAPRTAETDAEVSARLASLRLPDFFVIGAQKSGTTALCSLLRDHPGAYLSRPKEPMFFSRDDAMTHPLLLFSNTREWEAFDWARDRDYLIGQYGRLFEGQPREIACGEGSTSYLPSPRAADRIAELIPRARIIVLLRDPVRRAASAYWHMLAKGRTSASMSDYFRHEAFGLHALRLGHYREQLRHWMTRFPREQVHVELFEEFVTDRQGVLDRVCRFLGIEPIRDAAGLRESRNESSAPRSFRLALLVNALRRRLDCVPSALDRSRPPRGRAARVLDRVDRWNRGGRPPSIDPELSRTLRLYYRRENEGLADLIGKDLDAHWIEKARKSG